MVFLLSSKITLIIIYLGSLLRQYKYHFNHHTFEILILLSINNISLQTA